MDTWHSTFLGLRELPREISAFELQAFFTFAPSERVAIEQRRVDWHKLGLALHIGFLRMSGRPLDAFRIVPVNLLRHLGAQFGVQAPDLSSLRALYQRGRTLYDHQHFARELLGFKWMSEHQRRYLVRVLREELSRRPGCGQRRPSIQPGRSARYSNASSVCTSSTFIGISTISPTHCCAVMRDG